MVGAAQYLHKHFVGAVVEDNEIVFSRRLRLGTELSAASIHERARVQRSRHSVSQRALITEIQRQGRERERKEIERDEEERL